MGAFPCDFDVDVSLAVAASEGGAITESGVYVGKLTKCVHVTSKKGAEGYEFEFKCNDGRVGRYITIYTLSKVGEPIRFGVNMIHALGYLLKLPKIEHKQVGEDSNGQPVYGVPAVCNRPIGVMLESEDFERTDGTPGYQLKVRHWLDAVTKKTSTEKHNNVAEPETVKQYEEGAAKRNMAASTRIEAPASAKPESKPEPKPPAQKSVPWTHETQPLNDDLPF